MRLALVVAALALASALSPEVAFAQKKPATSKLDPKLAEAKRLFDEGADDYAKGDYEKAIEAWKTSYDLSQRPLIFESIANAYERLGKPREARDFLGKWRQAAPREEWELLDDRLKNLDTRIARDDQALAEQKAAEEKRKAEEDTAAKPAPPKPVGSSSSPLPTILMIGGGVLVVTGVVLDVAAAASRPNVSDACVTASDGARLCKTSARSGISSSNTLATVGDVTWIAGAVAAGVGLGLVVLRKRPSDANAPSRAPSAMLVPSIGGAALRGEF